MSPGKVYGYVSDGALARKFKKFAAQTMAPNHPSHELVRALKSAPDPPVPGGALKIEIASHAWEDASFYVPRKAEVIVDWILGKLLKEKLNAPCVIFVSL